MRKFLLAGLLAVSLGLIAVEDANAFFFRFRRRVVNNVTVVNNGFAGSSAVSVNAGFRRFRGNVTVVNSSAGFVPVNFGFASFTRVNAGFLEVVTVDQFGNVISVAR